MANIDGFPIIVVACPNWEEVRVEYDGFINYIKYYALEHHIHKMDYEKKRVTLDDMVTYVFIPDELRDVFKDEVVIGIDVFRAGDPGDYDDYSFIDGYNLEEYL